MISYVENYDSNDSAPLREAYGYAAGLSACVLMWAVLHHVYFYHISACGDEAESSRVPYDLLQGKCHSVPQCVPLLMH